MLKKIKPLTRPIIDILPVFLRLLALAGSSKLLDFQFTLLQFQPEQSFSSAFVRLIFIRVKSPVAMLIGGDTIKPKRATRKHQSVCGNVLKRLIYPHENQVLFVVSVAFFLLSGDFGD